MQKVLTLFLVLGFWQTVFSQQVSFSGGYGYLYSPQLNRSMDWYNFSRPWLRNEQPNFGSGLFANLSNVFPQSRRTVHSGISGGYYFHRSVAENTGFKSQLNFHLVEIDYMLHLESRGRGNHAYANLEVGALGGLMTRLINDENLLVDEEEYAEMGLGAIVRITIGYLMKVNERWKISPYISIGYAPFFYMPDSESVINQTVNLATRDNQPLLNGQIGISLQFWKPKKPW